MTFEKILYSVCDRRATVIINRPEVMNAFDYQTLRELERAFQETDLKFRKRHEIV